MPFRVNSTQNSSIKTDEVITRTTAATGDDTPITLYILLLGVAALAFVSVLAAKKKRN